MEGASGPEPAPSRTGARYRRLRMVQPLISMGWWSSARIRPEALPPRAGWRKSLRAHRARPAQLHRPELRPHDLLQWIGPARPAAWAARVLRVVLIDLVEGDQALGTGRVDPGIGLFPV